MLLGMPCLFHGSLAYSPRLACRCCLVSMGVVCMSMTFFPAINRGGMASLMGLLRQLVLYVPVMLVLPRLLGVKWVYVGSTAIDILVCAMTCMMLAVVFRQLRAGSSEAEAGRTVLDPD